MILFCNFTPNFELLKTKNYMNTNAFAPSTLEKAVETIKKLQPSIIALKESLGNKSAKELGSNMLVEQIGISKENADEIVASIQTGIDDFEKRLNEAQEDNLDFKTSLEKMSQNLSESQKHDLYVNVLTSLRFIQADDFTGEQIETLKVELNGKNTEELAEEIIKCMESASTPNILETVSNCVKDGVSKETIIGISEKIKANSNEYKLLSAVSLYIAQEKGEIEFAKDSEPLSPYLIGTITSAGVETVIKTGELEKEEISLAEWQKWLKIILGILLITLVAAVAFAGLYVLNFAVIYGILDLVGQGIIALLLIVFVCWHLNLNALKLFEKATDKILPFMSDLYDKWIVKITQVSKSLISILKAWIKKKESEVSQDEQQGSKVNCPNKPTAPLTGSQEGNTPPVVAPEPEGEEEENVRERA